MYKKILVPMALDHDISTQTLAVAQNLAGSTGKIIALHVYEAPQGSVAAYLSEDAIHEGQKRAHEVLREKLRPIPSVVTARLVPQFRHVPSSMAAVHQSC